MIPEHFYVAPTAGSILAMITEIHLRIKYNINITQFYKYHHAMLTHRQFMRAQDNGSFKLSGGSWIMLMVGRYGLLG